MQQTTKFRETLYLPMPEIFLFDKILVNLTWHIKLGMTLWKVDPLYPNPFSPVHRARKFSAVLGTTSARSSMTIRPTGAPSAVTSKKTRGVDMITVRTHCSLRRLRSPIQTFGKLQFVILQTWEVATREIVTWEVALKKSLWETT